MNFSSFARTPMMGLVLSGGGARGAYQAGVLKATGEIAEGAGIEWPFQIMTGLSAGAINCGHLASSLTSLSQSTKQLAAIWSEISADKVFRTDPASLSVIGARWVTSLASGGFTLGKKPQSLVDTGPLRRLITHHLNPDNIDKNIGNGRLHAVCITATEYSTSRGVSFVHAKANATLWNRARCFSIAQRLRPEHVMASSAIPILFPAIKIGERFYGDGCLRNLTPLHPAIALGATKLFVIGVRREMQLNDIPNPEKEGASAGRILSVLLNAVLMDGLESDLDNLKSINQIVTEYKCEGCRYKKIPVLVIRPSRDLSELAMDFESSIPTFVRFLTLGLGPIQQTAEMISYLLFESEFCNALIELGYNDAMNQSHEISSFLSLKIQGEPDADILKPSPPYIFETQHD